MSTLKVTNLQHPSSASANVTLDASGNADFNGKNLAGVASVNGGQLGGSNLVINGAMTVSQRGSSFTGLGASDTYTLDRYKFDFGSTSGRLTAEQSTDAPNGFSNSFKLSCTTADTSIAAAEKARIIYSFEGQDLASIGKGTSDAKAVTVSFYVKGNAAATYTCEFYDNDNNRQCSKLFNVTADWTRVELTFPADTTGAFTYDNNTSVQLSFWLMAGSDFTSGTLNSSAFAASVTADRVSSSQTNFFDSTSRTLFITGLQMETGDTATSFEHESYGTTLQKCHRYFEKITYPTSQYFAVGFVNNGSRGRFTLTYNHKRTTPSVSFTGSNLVYYSGSTNDSSTLTAEAPGLDSTRVNYELDNNTNQANGAAVGVLAVSGGVVMDVDAEL